MSHREYVQWAAYARHEPFGPAVDDWHHARTQAVIINAVQTALYAMGRAKHRRPVNPSDFMYSRPKTQDEKLRNLNAGLSALASRGSSSEH